MNLKEQHCENFLQSLHKEQWQEVRLGEVAEMNQKNIDKSYPHKIIQYLDTGSITNNKIESLQLFDSAKLPSRAKRIVQNNDIIYSLVRPIQRHFGFIKNPPENLIVSTGFCVITTNNAILDSKFLYYYLTLNEIIELLDMIAEASTSAYPAIRPFDIENLTIPLPPLTIQQKIAEILSSFDDKIDLLHRQNKTLESLALTLFRHYSTYKELDSIIGDIVALQSGYAFKSKDFQNFGKDRILKIKNIQNSIIDIINTDFINENISKILDSKFRIFGGDILFGMTGAEIGKMGIVPKNNETLWLNQRVGVLRGKFKGAKYLAYLHLTSAFGFDYIINAASGSAQPNISAKDIENCPFYYFTESELHNMSLQISPFFEKMIQNSGTILTLQAMRDMLLKAIFNFT